MGLSFNLEMLVKFCVAQAGCYLMNESRITENYNLSLMNRHGMDLTEAC